MACFGSQNGACFDEAIETTYAKWLEQVLKANKQKESWKKKLKMFLSLGSLSSIC